MSGSTETTAASRDSRTTVTDWFQGDGTTCEMMIPRARAPSTWISCVLLVTESM